MSAVLQTIEPAAPLRSQSPVPLLRTLALCDLADSTALVERLGDRRAAELFRKHDRLARSLVHHYGGQEIDKTDGFLMMFERPIQAVAFALAYQRGLRQLDDTGDGVRLMARVGIHVGDVVAWDNTPDDVAKGAKPVEVEGLVKPITSRLMTLALPGQILLSGVAFQLAHRAQGELGDQVATALWRTHGRYRFKGLPDPIAVFEVGEQDLAPLKAPPWSGKAHREVPFWRRPATMAIEILMVLALVAIPAWYLFRSEPAIAFAKRDWVVVGDLSNLTGETSFDDSLETAFRIGLEQSRYVNVLSDLKTRATVKLMQRDPAHTKLDRAIGSEVAIRDGARALILPTIAEIGGRVRVTAEVIDPQTQTTVYSESADGLGESSVLPSLDKVNQQLRIRLGEALATVSNESLPLEKVATTNLDALRAYSLGKQANAIGNFKEAMSFYRHAAQLDPQFALAHAAIGQALSDTEEADAALQEFKIAAAAPERLTPRDALYVAALQASLGPPGLAWEKWKQLATLYPDFFSAHGAYAMSLWQQANDYPAAIESVTKSASAKNPHFITSKHLLGVLYLGSERYDDAIKEFGQTSGFAVTQFHAAAYAAKRDYGKAQSVLGDVDSPASADELGRKIFAVAFDIDQGRTDLASTRLEKMRTESSRLSARGARRLDGAVLGTKSVLAPSSATESARDHLRMAQRAASGAKDADLEDIQFHILLSAYMAARQGDSALAREALASAAVQTHDANYPLLNNLRLVAEAEMARAQGRPQQALGLLKPLVNGRELYVTHVALMDAYSAAGESALALKEAQWLGAHRGRAYTEYEWDWTLVPFYVAQSNLAGLRAAELSLAIGNKAEARLLLDGFREHWRAALATKEIAARVQRVDAAVR